MLHYLYTATYTYPPTYKAQDFSLSPPPSMLFHLHLYTLAETLLIAPLKTLTQTRFQDTVEQEWHSESFPETIKRVYEITAPETGGDQLRAIVVKISASHGKELMGKGGAFRIMMGEVAEFGRDVFQVMMGAPIVEVPHMVEKERMVAYRCPVCPFEFYAKVIERSEIACSGCGVVSREGEWRSKKGEVKEAEEGKQVKGEGEGDRAVETETEAKDENAEVEVNGGAMKAEVEADEAEGKIEWNTMEVNGECVKDTEAVVETPEAEPQEPVVLERDEKVAVEEEVVKTKEDENEKTVNQVNGTSGNEEVVTEAVSELATDVVIENEKSTRERADSANGDGSVGGVETKESAGEIEETPIVVKKGKKGKKGKKMASAASALPTSPRATEAQIMGWAS